MFLFCFQDQLEAAYDEVRCKFNPPIEVFGTHGIQRNVTSLKAQNSDITRFLHFLEISLQVCALDVQMFGGLGMSADQTGTVRLWGKQNGELRVSAKKAFV